MIQNKNLLDWIHSIADRATSAARSNPKMIAKMGTLPLKPKRARVPSRQVARKPSSA